MFETIPMSTKSCTVFETAQAMQECAAELRRSNVTIGLVPTMGALHQGHLSLVHASMAKADITIVTIYVNPTQFGVNEDLSSYPRTFAKDLELLNELGVDFVFAPDDKQMYPEGCSTTILPPRVAQVLEGEYRPTHFQGVATIVAKLFHLTRADIAFFGQKDYQQSLVVQQMVKDLSLPIQIEVCPIVRDPDGLAMSSRNRFLSPPERANALAISQTLNGAADKISEGERDSAKIHRWMEQRLLEANITQIDYAQFADAETLASSSRIELPAVGLIAAYVGNTRLIDNILLLDTDNPRKSTA